MQPDLTYPGAADAFDQVVSLFTDAAAKNDPETMARAGFAFAALHAMTGGDRDALLVMVRDASVEAVRIAAGLQRPS